MRLRIRQSAPGKITGNAARHKRQVGRGYQHVWRVGKLRQPRKHIGNEIPRIRHTDIILTRRHIADNRERAEREVLFPARQQRVYDMPQQGLAVDGDKRAAALPRQRLHIRFGLAAGENNGRQG